MPDSEDYVTPLVTQVVGGVLSLTAVYVTGKLVEKFIINRWLEKKQKEFVENTGNLEVPAP